MLSKKEIKDIQSLTRKKFREELKLFIAEGPKIVHELIKYIPGQIEKVYATSEWIKTNQHLDIQFHLVEITDIELEKISQLQTPHQVVAITRQLENTEPDASFFTIYLDTIQDPGNLGTIIRIADWFNVKNIVCGLGCADLYNFKVVQATMGSIARVNVYYDEMGNWLQKQSSIIYAAGLQGSSLYTHSRIDTGILLVGNESSGIRQELLDYAKEKITIPKKGSAESLNAAVATGIILSHLLVT